MNVVLQGRMKQDTTSIPLHRRSESHSAKKAFPSVIITPFTSLSWSLLKSKIHPHFERRFPTVLPSMYQSSRKSRRLVIFSNSIPAAPMCPQTQTIPTPDYHDSLVSQSGWSVTRHGLIAWGLPTRLFLQCSNTLELSSSFISFRNCWISWFAVVVDMENSLKRVSAITRISHTDVIDPPDCAQQNETNRCRLRDGCFLARGSRSRGIVVRKPRSYSSIILDLFALLDRTCLDMHLL